jgi:pimeloyl-ACP methyl ester carboxylesterase
MQTWLALPDGKEEIDPGVRPCRPDGLPLVEDGGASGARADGHAVGRDRGDALPFADHLCRHRAGAGGSIPIDADADERAVMLVGGEAELDGSRSSRSRSTSCARPSARLSSATGGRLMLMGGEAFTPAPRLLELRLLVARPDQPGQGGLEGAALPADPRRRPGVHPAPRGAEDGQLSVTEFRRIELAPASRSTSRSPAPGARRSSCSTAFRNRTAPGARSRRGSRTASSWSCPTSAASPARTGRRTSRPIATDTLVDDIFALADALGLERFALVGHDWGGAIAGRRRCAATRG